MKVALDVSAVPARIAGAGRYIAELARRLPDADVATTLVSRRADVARWQSLSPRASVRGIVPDPRPARLLYEAWALGASPVARSVDVWHAPHYTMPRRTTTPVVVTIHDLTFFTNPEWHERSKVAFFRRAIKYSATHADVVVSVSDFTAALLRDVVPVRAPVVTAPLGVDLATFGVEGDDDADLRSAGLPGDVPFVLFVGTVEPRKGLDVLLTAFEQVARDNDTVELWLVGQTGWHEGPIESQIANHPFASRVRRLGFVDEGLLPVLYRRARVVAYPSRGEGFGLPVLEAMACGALVVTTRDTVMAEVAGEGATLVAVGDAPALAAALAESLACEGEERIRRGATARKRAESFTWETCVAQHLVAYDLASS